MLPLSLCPLLVNREYSLYLGTSSSIYLVFVEPWNILIVDTNYYHTCSRAAHVSDI